MPSESETLSDWQLKPRPGTDAALALGIAAQIFKEGLEDTDFLGARCAGLMAYKRETSAWDLARTEAVTGVSSDEIVKLARDYAGTKPASIWLGFGMQRHAGGGNAVRAVNALGAVTGNLGQAGGGVNYANRSSRVLNPLGKLEPVDSVRNVWKGRLAEDLDNIGAPDIEAAFINRCNPLLQAPDTTRLERAFERIPFKVVSDHFLTDTAQKADIVLPAATFLEETDLYYSYFHNYISLGRKAVNPSGEAKSDLWVLGELASRLGFGKEFERTPLDWIEYALEPMKAHGIDLDLLLEKGWVRFPSPLVPWTDHVFKTSTGKLNLGLPEPPTYIEPFEMPGGNMPFFLLTGALRDRLHSQYDNMEDADKSVLPKVYMNPEAARRLKLAEGQGVEVFTLHGKMVFELGFDRQMREDVLYAHHGRWKARGGGINMLTKGYLADMGGQGALYDCAAGIRPAEVR
jgi:anaerobic selenocysteine-containing dehydrogenase